MELSRHVDGRAGFALFLDRWVRQSSLTSQAFCRLAGAALGSDRIHPTQLSGLRNGMQKQISIYTFEPLSALNQAAAEFHLDKKQFADPTISRDIHLVPIATRFDHELATTADFVDLFLGAGAPLILPDEWLGSSWEGKPLAAVEFPGEDTGKAVRFILKQLDNDLLESIEELAEYYPSSDPERVKRLKMVCLDLDEYPAKAAETETLALCTALTRLTGQKIMVADLLKAAEGTLLIRDRLQT